MLVCLKRKVKFYMQITEYDRPQQSTALYQYGSQCVRVTGKFETYLKK